MIKENVCFTSGKLIVRAEVNYLDPLHDKIPQLMRDLIFLFQWTNSSGLSIQKRRSLLYFEREFFYQLHLGNIYAKYT